MFFLKVFERIDVLYMRLLKSSVSETG